MDEVGLGKSLQKARKKAGLTQQELCHKANLSYSTLAKIERGAIKSPSIFTIQNIASALGVSLGELVGEELTSPNTKKCSKSGVRFVYFDVNGVLVRFYHRAFELLSAETGLPADQVETAFWHFNDTVCRGELPMEEFNKQFAERIGAKSLDWQSYYMEVINPITEMQQLAIWAAECYQVGLLSNIMPGFIDEMFARGVLPQVAYDAIIDSSKVGAIKPEPRIFEVAQEWAECDPSEILLIDDSRANLMAAERMGWKVIWFDNSRPEESTEHIRAALEPDV